MYKQLRHVLTGITGQFTECELEQFMHRPSIPQPQCVRQLFKEVRALDRLHPLI